MKKLFLFLVLVINLYPQTPLNWVKVNPDLSFKSFSIWRDSLFLTSTKDGLNKSTDEGVNWELEPSNLPRNTQFLSYEVNSNIFAISSDSLYITNGSISNWKFLGRLGGNLYDFTTDDSNNIYFFTGNGLIKTNSTGDSLKKIINTPVISATWNNTEKLLFAVTNQHLYKSSNYGNTFTDITTPPLAVVKEVFYDDYNKILYIERDDEIYRSTDNGGNWIIVPNQHTGIEYFILPKGLIFRYKPDLYHGVTTYYYSISRMLYWTNCDPQPNYPWELSFLRLDKNRYIYMGLVYGKGLFRSTVPLDAVVDVNENGLPEDLTFWLNQNYPNPFNPETNITFSLKTACNVKLRVLNTLGQEIVVLLNDFYTEGSHSIRFDASNLPSGIYFYSIETEGFRDTKKMMLLK